MFIGFDYSQEVGALFTMVSSIRVNKVCRVGRVRVTLTVTVRVSRVSDLALCLVSGIELNKYRCE